MGAYKTLIDVTQTLIPCFTEIIRYIISTVFNRVDVSLILFDNAWNASFSSNSTMASCFNKRLLFRSLSWCCRSWWTCSLSFKFLSLVQWFFLLAVRISSLKFSFLMSNLWDCSSTIWPYFCDLWSPSPNFEFFASRTRLSWFRTSLRTFETRRDVVPENCSGVFDVENDIFSLP